MKKLMMLSSVLIVLVSLISCAHTRDSLPFPVGPISAEQLLSSESTFSDEYQSFDINSQQIEMIKQWPSNVRFAVYFGTWCHDSQREVPRVLKILSYNSNISTSLLALDYQKSDPEGLALQHGIKYTPTFIIYRDDLEIGRIIERPKSSLVNDINELLNHQ